MCLFSPSHLQDGVCLIHTVQKGLLLHTILPEHPQHPDTHSSVRQVCIADTGRLVVLAELHLKQEVRIHRVFEINFRMIKFRPSFFLQKRIRK